MKRALSWANVIGIHIGGAKDDRVGRVQRFKADGCAHALTPEPGFLLEEDIQILVVGIVNTGHISGSVAKQILRGYPKCQRVEGLRARGWLQAHAGVDCRTKHSVADKRGRRFGELNRLAATELEGCSKLPATGENRGKAAIKKSATVAEGQFVHGVFGEDVG